MRIVAISDTHMQHDKVKIPDGDVIVHCGDITNIGKLQHFIDFADWFDKLPHDHKIIVPGNHDISAEGELEDVVNDIFMYFDYLVEREVVIDGVKFYGVPHTPSFFPEEWVFNVDRGTERMKQIWNKMPDDTDVLVTHGPPFGYGDECPDIYNAGYKVRVGCADQLERLKEVKPKLVLCGHIHEGYGLYRTNFGTLVANVSTCNRAYKPLNKPFVIDI